MQGQTPESEIDKYAHLDELPETDSEAPDQNDEFALDEFPDNESEASDENDPDPEMMAWLEDPLGITDDENSFDAEMFQVSSTDDPCSEADEPSTADSEFGIEEEEIDPPKSVDKPIIVDGEVLETFDHRLTEDEFQGLTEPPLSQHDVDALLEAHEVVEAVAAPVEQKIDFLPVLDEIRHLRDGLASYQGLEHSLVELSQNSEAMGNTTLDQLDVLLDEVAALRQETEITRDATLVFTNTIRELVTSIASRKHRIGYGRGGSSGKLGFATLTIALLLCIATIGWAVRGYQHTGELHFAVIGLLVVNLIGGGAVLWSRRN